MIADPAKSDGRIRPGDELIEVGGRSLVGLSYSDGVAIIKAVSGAATFKVRKSKNEGDGPAKSLKTDKKVQQPQIVEDDSRPQVVDEDRSNMVGANEDRPEVVNRPNMVDKDIPEVVDEGRPKLVDEDSPKIVDDNMVDKSKSLSSKGGVTDSSVGIKNSEKVTTPIQTCTKEDMLPLTNQPAHSNDSEEQTGE